MDNATLDELISVCGDWHRTRDDELREALGASGLDLLVFCDVFARRIAHRYVDGQLDYEGADAAITNLVSFAFRPPDEEPGPYTWSVYHAFDAGEYQHPGDDPSVNPIERYTDPEIRRIVSKDREDTV